MISSKLLIWVSVWRKVRDLPALLTANITVVNPIDIFQRDEAIDDFDDLNVPKVLQFQVYFVEGESDSDNHTFGSILTLTLKGDKPLDLPLKRGTSS